MIMSCGNFPNVSLIGTWEGFILQNTTTEDPTLLKGIHVWKNINRGRSSLKRPRDESAIPYAEWIKERVRKLKLSFTLERPVVIRAPESVMVSMEEVEALNATILQLRREGNFTKSRVRRAL